LHTPERGDNYFIIAQAGRNIAIVRKHQTAFVTQAPGFKNCLAQIALGSKMIKAYSVHFMAF